MRTACGTALAEFCHYPTSTPPGPSSAGLELTKGPRATPSSLRGLEPNHFWISGLERGVTEGRAKAWAHQTALEDYEIEVVQTLGLNGVDWTDPVETLVALQGLLGEDGIPDEVDCMGLSLAAQAAVGANAYSGIARGPNVAKTIRQMMKRLRRRIQDSSTYKEGPQMAVRRFLQGFELASQGEVRRDHFLAQKGDGEALVRAATQVVPMALEALIEYPALADEMLSLAWEFAVRAVEEQR